MRERRRIGLRQLRAARRRTRDERLIAGALALAAAVAIVPGAGHSQPPDDCVEEAVARVQRRYESVRDLSAVFEQTTLAVSLAGSPLADEETSHGTVVLAKPGRMRWEYTKPEPSLVVSDGEVLWLYDPVAREVQRLVVDQGFLSGAALQFLLGGGRISDEFRVEAPACQADRVVLRLLPKREASYERLGLTVLRQSGDIVETTIVDLLGNETRIRFSELRFDRGPGAEAFRFEVPKGVELIDLVPPS